MRLLSSFNRKLCETFLQSLDQKLTSTPYLLGEKITLADIAIVPFIRQFAHVDIQWFEQSRYQRLSLWLKEFKASPLFNEIMTKFPTWEAGDKITVF